MKIKNILMSAAMIGTLASCNMDEVYYSQVVPDNFVEGETNVYQLLSRPFGHWRAFAQMGGHRYNINELMADVFICPARTTNDWYNGGDFMSRHYHTMDWQDGRADTNWKEAMQGIARCITVIEQINELNYAALNMTEEQRAAHLGQVQALMGFFYWQAMDWYGGVPIYDESTIISEEFASMLKPRNSEEEVRKFILDDFTAAETLPDSWDAANAGRATSGAATALK
ncbi:MAG: RagB/SusD family nutrient uptake outer membrane protein, partial [Muribaculaceae bacterium]|nr:RagB/SusD family nutrient uptake outer membrane protein [Muribaculaceae bacterium]